MTVWMDMAATIVFVFAAAFLRRGFFSNATRDGHPRCRRCRYDLFALPAGQSVCPECGADLTARLAVVTRLRRFRPFSAISGTALALVATSLLLPPVRRTAESFDPTPYKPVRWLNADLSRPDLAQRSADELRARLARGSRSSVDGSVRRIVSIQGDPRLPWTTSAGDFVVEARAKGMVGDETWERFCRAGVLLERALPLTRYGHFPVKVGEGRGPSRGAWKLVVSDVRWKIAGHPASQQGRFPGATEQETAVPGELDVSMDVPPHWVAELAGRELKIDMSVHCRLVIDPTRVPVGAPANATDRDVVLQVQFDSMTAPPAILEPAATTAAPAKWLASIRLYSNDPADEDDERRITSQRGRPMFVLTADPPPADLALVIVLIDDHGNRWPLTDLLAPAGERVSALVSGWTVLGTDWKYFGGRQAVVRLEFNPELTGGSGLLGPFLDVKHDLPAVPIQLDDGARGDFLTP